MTTYPVTNSDAAWTADQKALPGDIIHLVAGGDFSKVIWLTVKHLTPGVTFTADTGVTLPNGIGLGGTFYTFRGLDFALSGDLRGMDVQGAQDCLIDGCKFHQADNTTMVGIGMNLTQTNRVEVKNCEFSFLGSGFGGQQNTALNHHDNSYHDINVNGMILSATYNSFFRDSHYKDIYPGDGDHPDYMQFFDLAGAPPSYGNIIQGNLLEKGVGAFSQGIFIEGGAATNGVPAYRIIKNALLSTDFNGIALSGTIGAELVNNLTQDNIAQGTRAIMRSGVVNVAITDHWGPVVTSVPGDNPLPVNVTNVGQVNPIAPQTGPTDYTVYNLWRGITPPLSPPPPPPSPPAPLPPPPPPVITKPSNKPVRSGPKTRRHH